jgi:geranylgeranyl pyrophosphate synthase
MAELGRGRTPGRLITDLCAGWQCGCQPAFFGDPMDIHKSIHDYLAQTELAQTWLELSVFIQRACDRRDRIWRLPVLAGEAVGASRASLIPAAAAIACLHMHIILIDDMLDADPRGLHQQLGMPRAANLASALAALAVEAICRSNCDPVSKQAAISCLAEMCLHTSYGQHLDILNPDNESSYWAAVQAKSSPFFAAAFYLGTVMAGADAATAARLKAFGGLYGEMIQIFDDVHDSMARPANSDWIQGRSPLPVLFAQTVPHPYREQFVVIRRSIADPAVLEVAQDILIHCGAVSYCVDQIVARHQQAQQLLNDLPLPNNAELNALLEEIIRPVTNLLQ